MGPQATRNVAVFFSCGAAQYARKRSKSGRPPRAPQAGVVVPDGPACTYPPPYIMPPCLLPHERRIRLYRTARPPQVQLVAPIVSILRRDHTQEGGPHERGRRRRPPRALAAVSP
eukprot:2976016-Prymnesium_polylepis.1